MSEGFRDGPPADDAGDAHDVRPQIRWVNAAAGLGAVLLAASVVVDAVSADDPVGPQLPDLPTPSLPGNLPTDFSTDLPTDFPTDFPTDRPTELPDLPTDLPTGLPSFPELPTLPGGDG